MNQNESAAGAHVSGGATILIVDDDAGAVETFEHILKDNGYRVCVAPDAESGLLKIEQARPSAIIVDLHLPMADGVEFLRQLRTTRPQARIPVALVTGDYFVEESVAEDLHKLDVQIYFKPLWEQDLLKLVRELLDTRSQRQ